MNMFKKLVCRFTDGHHTYDVQFRAFTKMGMLKKACKYQSDNGLACLAMRYV